MPHYYTVTPDFSSLFFPHPETQRQTFSPKFDVYETASSYTVEADLPGLEKPNLNIEFTDPVTLIIKGKIERKSPAATTTPETPKSGSRTPSPARSLKATVEDDVDEEDKNRGEVAEKKKDAAVEEKRGEKRKEFRTRQWVSERTAGAFQRSFTFPAGIDQEGVTAALEHGVLRIVVPKMAPVSRRIEIS